MYVYTCHSVQWYRDDAVGVAFTVDSFVTATNQEVIGTWKKTKQNNTVKVYFTWNSPLYPWQHTQRSSYLCIL